MSSARFLEVFMGFMMRNLHVCSRSVIMSDSSIPFMKKKKITVFLRL